MNPSTGQSEVEAVVQSGEESLSGRLAESLEELQTAEEELRRQNLALLEAQEALQFEQQQYRVLFENAPNPYLVTDLYGTVRVANRAAIAILNARLDLVGKPLMAFIALQDRPEFRERVNALAKAADAMPPIEITIDLHPRRGTAVRCTVTVTRSMDPRDGAGTLLWMVHEVANGAMRELEHDAGHDPMHATSATADFHSNAAAANREMVAELRHLNSELRAANRETLALLRREQKLRRALERAEGAKSHFFAVLSHELRTPLQAIFGYTELLVRELGESATAASRDYLHRIERSERHLLDLINNILDFDRMTRGSAVQPDVGPLPVPEVLGSLEAMMSTQAVDRGIALTVECADAALVAAGDRAMVQQVMVNLVSNALKFTPEGGHVTVDARRTADATIAIMVCDTGRGIPPDELERIFEPFTQVSLRDSRQGAGLGLAISRNIARSLGGELSAESTPGQGSRFTLTLPEAHLASAALM